MDLIISQLGAISFLEARLNQVFPSSSDLYLCLAVNDPEVLEASTVSIFTEASGGGYARKTLATGSWVMSDVAGLQQAAYAEQLFVFTGALDATASIYWWYIIDDNGDLMWSFKMPASYTPSVDGLYFTVIPKIQASFVHDTTYFWPDAVGGTANWFFDAGAESFFKARLNNDFDSASADIVIRAASCTATPLSPTSDHVDLTFFTVLEDSTNGDVEWTLTAGNWTTAIEEGHAIATYAEQTFAFTGAPVSGECGGFYAVDASDNVLWACGVSIMYEPENGDSIYFTPRVAFISAEPRTDIGV